MKQIQQAQPTQGISHFGLYAESMVDNDPGFVRIEDIAALSKEYGWLIAPHRHNNMFQFLCIFDGQFEVQLDERSQSLTGSWVIIIPPGVVHGFSFKPTTIGALLTLAEPLLTEDQCLRPRRYFEKLVRAPQTVEFERQSILFDQLRRYLNEVAREFNQAQTGHKHMMELRAGMVLVTIKRQFDRQQLQASISVPSSIMLKKFHTLLEINFKKQWQVQQYASTLHTSVSSLNRLCKQSIGVTVKVAIQHRMLVEMKRQLIYTQVSLDQIAYRLGFKDPAYFSRFFKKLEGVPPSRYREAHDNSNFELNSA